MGAVVEAHDLLHPVAVEVGGVQGVVVEPVQGVLGPSLPHLAVGLVDVQGGDVLLSRAVGPYPQAHDDLIFPVLVHVGHRQVGGQAGPVGGPLSGGVGAGGRPPVGLAGGGVQAEEGAAGVDDVLPAVLVQVHADGSADGGLLHIPLVVGPAAVILLGQGHGGDGLGGGGIGLVHGQGQPGALVHHPGEDGGHLRPLDGRVGVEAVLHAVLGAPHHHTGPVEPVDGRRLGMGGLHVGDGVVHHGVLLGQVGHGGGEDLRVPRPGGLAVPAVVLADDVVGLAVVHIGGVPGVLPHGEGHGPLRPGLVHTGRQLHRLGVGHALVRTEGGGGDAVHQAGFIGLDHVVVVPLALRHILEGQAGCPGQGDEADRHEDGQGQCDELTFHWVFLLLSWVGPFWIRSWHL